MTTRRRANRKVVKPLAKGQITIPAAFREALDIDPDTLLSVSLADDHLEIRPLREEGESLRRYTDEDITQFLEEDKLDPEVARKVRDFLRQGAL